MNKDAWSIDLDREIIEICCFLIEYTESMQLFYQQSLKPYQANMPEQRIVTNRVFVLGLDELYREVMKNHESIELSTYL